MPASELKQNIAVSDVDDANGVNDEMPGCSVCPHPWNDHDAIATRFCAATVDHQFSRGCVCTPKRV